MWKLYVKNADGVALKTTVGHLKEAISQSEEQLFIGKIKHADYNAANFNDIQWFDLFFHKRVAFEHENEMRVAFVHGKEVLHPVKELMGLSIPIRIHSLFQKVVTSATSIDLFDKTKRLLEKHNISSDIEPTELALPPFSALSLFKFVKTLSSKQ